MSLRWLPVLTTILTVFSIGNCLAAQPNAERGGNIVSDQDVARYINTFTARPRPNVAAKIDYRSFVSQIRTPVSWFVGRWLPPGGEGEINVYPSMMSDRVCILIKTSRSIAYSDARLEGKVLRTNNPLFTEDSQKYLRYAASDVLIPVMYQGRGYLGWGLFDSAHKSSRFLTLAFDNAPADPAKLLTGRSGAAIAAQFQAAGCQGLARPRSESASQAVQQTIDNVIVQVQPISTTALSRTFQLKVQNNSAKAFGFMPNRVVVYDQNRRRLNSQFSTLVHGAVIEPGGMLTGTVTVYTQNANRIVLQIPEATPSNRRMFNIPIEP